ncbi:MAG TPA: FxLYD domain-containing protein [Thermoanaerobaculia bacterium]|nr:FxLYD domain-containing protein [Thermoanaerobaculia bacterium]
MKTGQLSIPILLLAGWGLAAPASADWLVTREGARLETQGPWKVKGKLVVFTLADGSLSSLRLDAVDLPASDLATAQAKEVKENPPPPPEPVKRKSIVSLTDADFRKVEPPAPPPGTAPAPGKPEEPAEAASQQAVVVQTWDQVESSEGAGLFITGTVANTVDTLATNIELTVELFNEEKESLGTALAVLSATSIRPGGTAAFRAAFPNVFAFTEARFNVVSRNVIVTPTSDETDAAASPES